MSIWTGDQNCGGYEAKNIRFEMVAALPAPYDAAWEGRPIYVTAGADEGPWVGGAAAWKRLDGVSVLHKLGDAELQGAVTLSEGANITLTQAGQDIQIAAAGGGGGLQEPGLMCYIEPAELVEGSYGFVIGSPGFLQTARPLLPFEQIRLRVQRDNLGAPVEIAPATLLPPGPFGDMIANPFYFDLAGDFLTTPIGYFLPLQIVGHIGVYDSVGLNWVDMMSIRVEGGGFPP
jgi:hypothetical protein